MDNNSELISSIYQQHIRQLYRFFYFKTFSSADAEDLCSETFIQFAKSLSRSVAIDSYQNYLYGIARKVFLRYLKSRRPEVLFSDISDNFLELVVETNNLIDNTAKIEPLIKKVIDQLPAAQKLVMELRLIKHLTVIEISQKLAKPINTVKITQRRAIKKMQAILQSTPINN